MHSLALAAQRSQKKRFSPQPRAWAIASSADDVPPPPSPPTPPVAVVQGGACWLPPLLPLEAPACCDPMHVLQTACESHARGGREGVATSAAGSAAGDVWASAAGRTTAVGSQKCYEHE